MSECDLFVVTAPSGTGKTTLIKRLLSEIEGIDFSVSYTTRPMRQGEKDGVDYHFVDRATFDGMIAEGGFLEWAEVHGRRYGTSAKLVDQSLAQGRDVLLDVDTQGAASVRRLRSNAVLVFILPPDFETLRERLKRRGLEDEAEMERRIRNARAEVEQEGTFDYLIVNDSLEDAVARLEAIVLAHRSRAARQREASQRILASFRNG